MGVCQCGTAQIQISQDTVLRLAVNLLTQRTVKGWSFNFDAEAINLYCGTLLQNNRQILGPG